MKHLRDINSMTQLVNCLLFALVASVGILGLVTPSTALSQQQCGASAPSDIVIMIDLSGSQSAATIEAQKTGARTFLDSFAQAVIKPKVALLTYNSNCDCGGQGSYDPCDQQGEVNCYSQGFDHARIVVPLSQTYTVHYQQLAPGSGIQGGGPNHAGIGGTNLKKAIETAQGHLISNGNPNFDNNIILLSDGEPNMPGYFLYPLAQCNNCVCAPAELEAQVAANTAKIAGTTIYTALAGSTCGGGNAFLQNVIATSPAHHFSNPNNLPAVFQAIFQMIADIIGCSDGQTCTTDYCGGQGLCEYIPLDSDGDGVNDCVDTCVGNNALLGQGCDGGDPDSCNGGVYVCPTGVLSCNDNPQLDDSDGDGVPNCIDNCIGNNSLIGQACDGTDPDPCNGGVYVCGTGTLACNDNPQIDDSDGDGIPNCQDNCNGNNGLIGQACDGTDPDPCNGGVFQCPGGVFSCSDNPQIDDSDGDGAANCVDQCPNDGGKIVPGTCGCGVADTDSDGDGFANCVDACPSDSSKALPGVCGCGTADTDSDGDGSANCGDPCSTDPAKIQPGVCGCGTPDRDTNSNGVIDCLEQAPSGEVCSTTDVQGYINSLDTTLGEQYGQVRRLLRRLSLVRAKCPNRSQVERFISDSRKTSNKQRVSNQSQIDVLPATTLSCPASLGCANSVIPFNTSTYMSGSATFKDLALDSVALERACSQPFPGQCEGDIQDCLERARDREALRRSEKRQARRLDTANGTTTSALPKTTATCN